MPLGKGAHVCMVNVASLVRGTIGGYSSGWVPSAPLKIRGWVCLGEHTLAQNP